MMIVENVDVEDANSMEELMSSQFESEGATPRERRS